jgi:chemotaxis protein CheD
MNTGAANTVKKEVAIHIGDCHVSREPTVIRTVLGSCVAVCLFDPVTQIGGMNHILLPGQADLQHYDAPTRYALNAMDLLINDIMKLGGKRYNLTAKVFGGGHIIPGISEEFGMGQKNIAFVLEFLRVENIRITGQDLGGVDSRRVYFHTDSGAVFLKRIVSANLGLAKTEEKYIKRVQKQGFQAGAVELFGQEK